MRRPLRLHVVLPLAALALLATGCVPRSVAPTVPTETTVGFPNHTPVQIRALVEASVAGVQSYRTEARLAITNDGRNLDVTAGARARLADTMFVVVRGPLGIEGGRALVTPDSMFAIDRLRGRYFVGPLSAAERYVPGAGRPGRLARALLGLEAPPATAEWTVRAQGTRYVLSAPGNAQTWVIDPTLWRAVSVEERASDGRRLTRSYEGFEAISGVQLPRRVVMASPDDGATISVDHRSITVNPADLEFPFTFPADAEITRIR